MDPRRSEMKKEDEILELQEMCARAMRREEKIETENAELKAEIERLEKENASYRAVNRKALMNWQAAKDAEAKFEKVIAAATDLLRWHDEEPPNISGHLVTSQVRAGHSFKGEWEPCGEIVERLRALLYADPEESEESLPEPAPSGAFDETLGSVPLEDVETPFESEIERLKEDNAYLTKSLKLLADEVCPTRDDIAKQLRESGEPFFYPNGEPTCE